MAERVLALSSDPWEMDQDNGKKMAGTTLWFLNRYREEGQGSRGFKPSKVSVSDAISKEFREMKMPAVVELDYGTRPGAQGKATLTVIGVKYVSSLNMDSVFNAQPKA